MSTPEPDPQYVAARRVLLDALIGLGAQATAVIVVGAQAIYLRTGQGSLPMAPFTTDGDLAFDPRQLSATPELDSAMRKAGFKPDLTSDGHRKPGTWLTTASLGGHPVTIPVDLMVPDGVAPPGGRRGVRLGAHGNQTARRTSGLEAALVDHTPIPISALDPQDSRTVVARVAGEAALLIAKAHKLHERLMDVKRRDRLNDKDAGDIVRLMQATDPNKVGERVAELRSSEIAGESTAAGLTYLVEMFSRPGLPGVQMASRALEPALPSATTEALCAAYVTELRRAVEGA